MDDVEGDREVVQAGVGLRFGAMDPPGQIGSSRT
jgi:hypothetical protein